MSEALCGPSNSLQQFKQHTQIDRTLQQDRLTSRHSPAHVFRTPDPNAGLLDPEFEAFQAGLPIAELPHYRPFPRSNDVVPSTQTASWADDFQRLGISPAPPLQHQLQQQAVPYGASASAGWTQGFHEHLAKAAPRAHSSSPSPLAFQQRARYRYSGFQSPIAQASSSFVSSVSSKGKEPVHEHIDEAAFERAFDEATQYYAEAQVELQHTEESVTTQDRQRFSDSAMDIDFRVENETTNYLNADSLVDTEDGVELEDAMRKQAEAEQAKQEEDDALAVTAQELLEKVRDNQTEKFRNSQFLGLMRKLRDREVKVDGDKMVETNAPTSSSSSLDYEKATTSLNVRNSFPRFDNSEQRPSPLDATLRGAVTDIRPPDYGHGIPLYEQDHDTGRVDSRDGQEVVELLQKRGALSDDIGMSSSVDAALGSPFHGDWRPKDQNESVSEMLYGADGTLASPVASTRTGVREEAMKHGLSLDFLE